MRKITDTVYTEVFCQAYLYQICTVILFQDASSCALQYTNTTMPTYIDMHACNTIVMSDS